VCQHLTSPASDGLFSQAIIESGDCDGPWAIMAGAEAKRFGDVYLSAAGCPSTPARPLTGASRLACLRWLPLKQIQVPYLSWLCLVKRSSDPWCLQANATMSLPSLVHHWPSPRPPFAPLTGFAAVVDGSMGGLPGTPLSLIQQGKINRSPKGEQIKVIMGTNTDEFALFMLLMPVVVKGATLPVSASTVEAVVKHIVSYHDHWNETTVEQVLAAYPSGAYATQAYRLTTMATDFVFRCGTRTAARALANQGIVTHLYQFDYHHAGYLDPASKACELDSELLCGVFHASELPFVFSTLLTDVRPSDRKMSSTIGTYWANFAKYGTPNGAGVDVRWPAYTQTKDEHLRLASQVEVGSGYGKVNCDFWDSLPRQTSYPH